MNVQPKTVTAIVPVSVTNAGTATGVAIDTLGYDRATIVVEASTSNDATNNESVLKLQESAITDATGFADITAFVGDTAFTIPNAVTTHDGKSRAQFQVDLTKPRKRYLRVLASPLTTVVFAGTAFLTKGEEAPDTAAKAGCGVLVVG